ncbi:helicase-related protein [Streptomyces microflavus]|uniref:helicase-related protein n=1 Tax=Streptomyces microflavus TaxID=1919 RepID=UPI00364CD55B
MQITNAAERLADTLEAKRSRRAWNPDLHPRDSKGRFIETGGIARMWGGGMARVLRALGGRNVLVENVSTRQRSTVHASRLTMVARPDGTAPTRSKRKVRDEDERRVVDARRGTGIDADDPGDEGDTPDDPHEKDDNGEELGEDKEGEDLGEGPEPEDDDPLLPRGRVFQDGEQRTQNPAPQTTFDALPMPDAASARHRAGQGNALRAPGPKSKDDENRLRFTDSQHAQDATEELDSDYLRPLAHAWDEDWDDSDAQGAYEELSSDLSTPISVGEDPEDQVDQAEVDNLLHLADVADSLSARANEAGRRDIAEAAATLASALEMTHNRFEAHGNKPIPRPRANRTRGSAWEPQPVKKTAAKKTAAGRRKDPNRRFKSLTDVRSHWGGGNLTPFTSDEEAQQRHTAATADLFDKLETPQLSRNGHFVIGQMGVQRRNGETHHGWGVILTDSGVRLTLSPRKAEAADFVKRLEAAQLDGKPFDWNARDYQSRLNTPEGQAMVREAAAAARQVFTDKAAKKRAGAAARTTPAPATSQQRAAQQIADRTGVPAANVAVGHVGSESFGDDRGRPRNDAELREFWKAGGDETTPGAQRDMMREFANHPDITLHLADHRGLVIMEDRRKGTPDFQVRATGTSRPISAVGQRYGVFEDRDTAERFALVLGSELRDQTGRTVDWGAPRLNRDLIAFRDKDNRPFSEAVREIAGQFDRDRGRTDSEAAKYAEALETQKREQADQSPDAETSTSPGQDQSPAEGNNLSQLSRADLDAAYKQALRDQADGEYDDDVDKASAAAAEAEAILAEAQKRDADEHAAVLDRVSLGAVNDKGDRPVAIDGDGERMATLKGAPGRWTWNRLGHQTRYSSKKTFLTREAALADLVRERDEERASAPSPTADETADTGRPADSSPSGQNADESTAAALNLASQQLMPVLNSVRAKHGDDVAAELLQRATEVVDEHAEGELSSSDAIAAFQAVLDDVQRSTRGLEGRDNIYVQDLLRLARENVGVVRAALADQRKRDKDRGVRGSGANVLADVPAGRGGADGQHRAGGVRAGEGRGDRGGDQRPGGRAGAADEGGGDSGGAPRAADAGPVRGESVSAAGAGVRDGEGAGDGGEGHAARVPASPGRVAFGSPEQEAVAPSFEPPAKGEPLAPSSPLNRVKANIAAIEILRRLEAEERPATAEEQKELARWSGWGATPQVFKPKPDEKFAPLQAKLRELLTEDEWREARANTKNAHYTDPRIVQQIWDAVGNLGFDGGDVLEPGSGSGNFIGYAPAMARMMGVELDPITARISKALYPHSDVRHESFGDTRAPNAAFDLAIGNVPFGRYKVPDLVHNKGNHSIHNHFILKSLELTRPGGLVAMVTSSLTMDGHGQNAESARMEMASKAHLVGAIRLPSGAHQRTAGTGVVTDLLIFRRRERDKNFTSGRTRTKEIKAPSQRSQNDPPMWVHSLPRFGLPGQLDPEKDETATPVHYNSYFHDRPEQILGELSVGHGMNRADELRVDGNSRDPIGELRKALKRTVAEAKAAGLGYQAPPEGRKRVVLLPPGSPRVDGHVQAEPDGAFTQVRDGMVHPFPVPKTQANEARLLLAIRDTYQSLLAEESRKDADESLIERLRSALNEQYEAYAKQYGAINRFEWAKRTVTDPETGEKVTKSFRKKAPRGGLFSKDPTMSASVASLDDYDDITDTTTRAAIFSKRQGTYREIAERADAPQDALAIVLEQYGDLTPAALATVMGTDAEDATARLLAAESVDPDTGISYPLAFQQPDGTLVPAADYLSGNVREKLAEARRAAVDDDRFEVNVDHLERVIPPDLSTGEIAAPMGASWIGREPVQQFLRETLNSDQVTVSWQGGALWAVDAPDGVKKQIAYRTRDTWSGPGYDALKLAEAILTNRKIRVTFTTKEGTFFDQKATDDAVARADQLKEAFTDWLWADPDRAELFKRRYNDTFNSMAPRSYDGQRRTMPGLVEWFNPHGHQHSAVSRMVNEPAVLLAHEVGAGKTAEMTMGVMELRRLGLIKKAAMVVPGHMLDQFTTEFAELYPESVANNRILAAGSADLEGNGRREFIARAASGDYDAIIMTQTAFESIQMRHEVQEQYIRRQLDALEEKIRRQKEIDGEDNDTRLVKRMETQLANRHEKLTKKLSGLKDAAGLHFEDMGIDYLVVDEAHMYKNLYTPSSIDSAAIEGSNRASDLEMKLEYLRERTGTGRVVTFATATPVANSITEVHTMMRYLRPDLLRQLGIEDFDDFASAFGKMVSAIERSPDGTYKEKTRLAAFQNVPELMRIWRAFADVKNSEDLDIPGIPDVAGGKAVTITMPMSEAQEEYEEEIKARAAKLASGGVDPREDNYLKLMSDGRAAALDPRLLDMEMGPGNKLPTVADNIVRIHEQTKDVVYPSSKTDSTPHPTPGGLQIVFLDLGTPKDPGKTKKGKKKDGEAEGAEPAAGGTEDEQAPTNFSTYDELKALLIARGIPAEQIRFIHDAKDDAAKARLFHEARTGKISVLLGSTQKMGTGTNVQLRATALHHVDAPWRPADVEQRNGRVIRQGNANGEAAIFQYATERSTDAKFWEAIARKARFIRQLMRGSLTERVVEDIGEIKFDADESAALIAGDPHLIAQASLRPIVKRLRARGNAHQRSQEGFEKSIRDAERAEDRTAVLVGELEDALQSRKATRGADFNARIGTTDFEGTEGRSEARAALNEALRDVLTRGRQGRIDEDQEPEIIGQIGGLTVSARYRQRWDIYRNGYIRGVTVEFPGIPFSDRLYQDHDLVDLDSGRPQSLPLMRLEDSLAGIEGQIRRAGDDLSDKRRAAAQAKLRVGKPFDLAEDLAKSEQQLAILDQIMRLKAKAGVDPKEQEAQLRTLDQELRELIGEEEDVLAQVSARDLDLNPKTPAPPAITTDEQGRTRYVWPDAEARKAARDKERAEKREAAQARQRQRDEAAPPVPDALGMDEAELAEETERLGHLIADDEASEADVLRHAGLAREQTRRAKKKPAPQAQTDTPEENEAQRVPAEDDAGGTPESADGAGSDAPPSREPSGGASAPRASTPPAPDSSPTEDADAPASAPAPNSQQRPTPSAIPYATTGAWREGLAHVDAAETRLGMAASARWGYNDDDAPSAIPLLRRAVLDAIAAQEDDDYDAAEQHLAEARNYATGLLDTLEGDERGEMEAPLTDFLITLDGYLARHRATHAQWAKEDAEQRTAEAEARAVRPGRDDPKVVLDPVKVQSELGELNGTDSARQKSALPAVGDQVLSPDGPGEVMAVQEESSSVLVRAERGTRVHALKDVRRPDGTSFGKEGGSAKARRNAESLAKAATPEGVKLSSGNTLRDLDFEAGHGTVVDDTGNIIGWVRARIGDNGRRYWWGQDAAGGPPGSMQWHENLPDQAGAPPVRAASVIRDGIDRMKYDGRTDENGVPSRQQRRPILPDRGIIEMTLTPAQVRELSKLTLSGSYADGTPIATLPWDSGHRRYSPYSAQAAALAAAAREAAEQMDQSTVVGRRAKKVLLGAARKLEFHEYEAARRSASLPKPGEPDPYDRPYQPREEAPDPDDEPRPGAEPQETAPSADSGSSETADSVEDAPARSSREERAAEEYRRWAGVWADRPADGPANAYEARVAADAPDDELPTAPENIYWWVRAAVGAAPLAQYDENARYGLERAPEEAHDFLAGQARDLRSRLEGLAAEFRTASRRVLMDNVSSRDGMQRAREELQAWEPKQRELFQQAVRDQIAKARAGADEHGMSGQEAEDFVVGVVGGSDPDQFSNGEKGAFPDALRSLRAAAADAAAYWAGFGAWSTQDDSGSWDGYVHHNRRLSALGAGPVPSGDPSTGTGVLKVGEAELPAGMKWVRAADLRAGDIYREAHPRRGTADEFDGLEPPSYVIHTHADGTEGALRTASLDGHRGSRNPGPGELVVLIASPDARLRKRARSIVRSDAFLAHNLPRDEEALAQQAGMPTRPTGETADLEGLADGEQVRVRGTNGAGGLGTFEGYVEGTPERAQMWRGGQLVDGWKVLLRRTPDGPGFPVRPFYVADGEEDWAERMGVPSRTDAERPGAEGGSPDGPGTGAGDDGALPSDGSRYGGDMITAAEVRNGDWVSVETTDQRGEPVRRVGEVGDVREDDGRVHFTVTSRDPQSKRDGIFQEFADVPADSTVERLPEGNPGRQDNSDLVRRMKRADEESRAAKVAVPDGWTAVDGARIQVRAGDRYRIAVRDSRGVSYMDVEVEGSADYRGDGYWRVKGQPRRFLPRDIVAAPEGADVQYAPGSPAADGDAHPDGQDGGTPATPDRTDDERDAGDGTEEDRDAARRRRRRGRDTDAPGIAESGGRDGGVPSPEGSQGDVPEGDEQASEDEEGGRRDQRRRRRDRNRPGGDVSGPRGRDLPQPPSGGDDDGGRTGGGDASGVRAGGDRSPATGGEPRDLDTLRGRYRSGRTTSPQGADPEQHAAYLARLASNDTLALSPGGGLITWSDNGGRTWQFGHAASGLHLAGWEAIGALIGDRDGAIRLAGAYEELRDGNGEPIDWSAAELNTQSLRSWRDADGNPVNSAIEQARQRIADTAVDSNLRSGRGGTRLSAAGTTREDPGVRSDGQQPSEETAGPNTGSGSSQEEAEDSPSSQYLLNAPGGSGGTVDGHRVPTAKEMERYTAGPDRVVSEEGELALFGSAERMRELAAEGFNPTPVLSRDRDGQIWRNGRLIGTLFAPHLHTPGGPSAEGNWWSHPPFFPLPTRFATREAAIAHLVLRDKERGEPDLGVVHPELAWFMRTTAQSQGFPGKKKPFRGLESLEGNPADLERYHAIRTLLNELGRGVTPSGNVAEDLAHLHDELRWLNAVHYEHQEPNLKDPYILGPGWLAEQIGMHMDVLRPEDSRAQHHDLRKNRAARQFLDELLRGGGLDNAVRIPVSDVREGDIVELDGRITGFYAGYKGRRLGYVISGPAKARFTAEGVRYKGFKVTVTRDPFEETRVGVDTTTFIIPADGGTALRLASANDIELPFDQHTYGRRIGETPPSVTLPSPRPEEGEENGRPVPVAGAETGPAQGGPSTRTPTSGPEARDRTSGTNGTDEANGTTERSGAPQQDDRAQVPAAPSPTGPGDPKEETEAGASGPRRKEPSGPEPIGGRPAEWVKVSDLGLRDLVRIEGTTKNGTPRTLAGYVVDGPQEVPSTRARRVQDMYRVLISDTPEGRGKRNSVWVMPDATAARATRDDSDQIDGAPQTGADSDVLTGRISERVPTDRNGNGLFPGSTVTANDGREGVVTGANAGTANVQFGDDRTDDTQSPTSLNVTDGGAARPSGWTTDGHLVRPGHVAGDREGNMLGTVEEVDGETATVATPQGMRDVPAGDLRVLGGVAEGAPAQSKAQRLDRVPVGELAEGDVILVDSPTGMSAARVTRVEEVRPGHIRITAADVASGEDHTLDGSSSSVYTRVLGSDGQAPELNENDAPGAGGEIASREPSSAADPVTGPTVDPQLSSEERDAIADRGNAPAGDPDAQQGAARLANDLPITPKQATALAEDLREGADSSTPEGRATQRAADHLDAATGNEPDAVGRPEPGTVGTVGVGDTIALPGDFDPSSLSSYKVTAIEDGPGGVRTLTVEDRDGRRTKRTMSSDEALFQLPEPQAPSEDPDAEPRDPNPAPDIDKLRTDYTDSVMRAVINNAIQGTTTPGSIHQLREQIAAQLTAQALRAAMRRARDGALSAITDAGIDGDERTDLVRSLRTEAARARKEAIQAAVRTVNDLEPLEGESEEDTARRAADLLRLIPEALHNRALPDSSDADPRVDDTVSGHVDDAVGEALQSAAARSRVLQPASASPGGLTDERRAAIVRQLAERMAANRDATAQRIASTLPAGQRAGLLPSIVAALVLLARKVVAIVAAFLRALAQAWRNGRDAVRRLRDRIAHFRRSLIQRIKSWPEARRLRRLAAVSDLPGLADGLLLSDRLAHWARLMPAPGRFGQVSRRARWYQPTSRAALRGGRLPLVQDGIRWVPDRAADGGPGPQALRHLAALRAAGLDVDSDIASRLAAEVPELGDDPHSTVRHASAYADTAERRLRDLRAAAAGGAADVGLELGGARREAEAARQEAQRLQQAYAAALPDAVRGVLAEVRDMGPAAGATLITTPDSDPEATRALIDVSQFIPRDWLVPTESRFLAARSGDAGRYDGSTATVADLGDAGRRTAANALLAHLQRNYPDLVAAQEAFHFSRTHRGRPGARRRTSLEVRLGRLFGDRATQGSADDIVPLGLAAMFSGDWYEDDDLRAFLLGLLATR